MSHIVPLIEQRRWFHCGCLSQFALTVQSIQELACTRNPPRESVKWLLLRLGLIFTCVTGSKTWMFRVKHEDVTASLVVFVQVRSSSDSWWLGQKLHAQFQVLLNSENKKNKWRARLKWIADVSKKQNFDLCCSEIDVNAAEQHAFVCRLLRWSDDADVMDPLPLFDPVSHALLFLSYCLGDFTVLHCTAFFWLSSLYIHLMNYMNALIH